jgi:hypothetical protein
MGHSLNRRPGRSRWHGEQGTSRLKAIVWLAILGAMVFAGVKVVPVLINDFQFQDAMKTTARFASVNRQTPDDIRNALLKEAARSNLPLRKEDIRVTSVNGNVRIEATYSVTVDLALYQWTLNFHPTATNSSI